MSTQTDGSAQDAELASLVELTTKRSDPAAREEILLKLVRSDDPELRRFAVDYSGATEAVLLAGLHSDDKSLHLSCVDNPNATAAVLLEGVANPDLQVAARSIYNKNATAEVVQAGFDTGNPRIQMSAVQSPLATEEALEKLIADPKADFDVRRVAVAHCPANSLHELFKDKNPEGNKETAWVQQAALENFDETGRNQFPRKVNEGTLLLAAENSDRTVVERSVQHPDSTPEVAVKAIENPVIKSWPHSVENAVSDKLDALKSEPDSEKAQAWFAMAEAKFPKIAAAHQETFGGGVKM